MKILCVGDSLGLPRYGVLYEDTWFYKLCMEYPQIHFIPKFVRELTTDRFNPKGDFSAYYNPDIVITQFGIVDCAPRIINDRQTKWKLLLSVSSHLGLQSLIWKWIKRRHHRDNPRIVYVKPKDFENNIQKYFDTLLQEGVRLIIIVKIGMPGQSVRKKSPCIAENVKVYNTIYEKIATLSDRIITIDPLCAGDDHNYIDGYHTNKDGFQLVYNQIKQVFADNEIF